MVLNIANKHYRVAPQKLAIAINYEGVISFWFNCYLKPVMGVTVTLRTLHGIGCTVTPHFKGHLITVSIPPLSYFFMNSFWEIRVWRLTLSITLSIFSMHLILEMANTDLHTVVEAFLKVPLTLLSIRSVTSSFRFFYHKLENTDA